jgi:hypothetical protein
MSRKTIYLPTHIKDRLKKYQVRNGLIDEQTAIIRLINVALVIEEKQHDEDMLQLMDHENII